MTGRSQMQYTIKMNNNNNNNKKKKIYTLKCVVNGYGHSHNICYIIFRECLYEFKKNLNSNF